MATTTNYGWTTPDDTALVKDGASAIRTLGTSVDTTTKNLNPETTLGDIAYRSSTSNVKTRLGIGSTGQILTVASGVPSWATPAPSSPASATANVSAQQSTSSATFTDLATVGPSVTLTTGTKALVIYRSRVYNSGANQSRWSFAVSGATTIAASSTYEAQAQAAANSEFSFEGATLLTTLTAGSNTFTMKYSTNGGTAYFERREIIVIDMGS